MSAIVVYKTKYGSTRTYAQWIAEELCCEAKSYNEVTADDLMNYDTIVYGGGLYAEIIAGVSLITKNLERLSGKKIIVFTTGITPIDCDSYYKDIVVRKNFKGDSFSKVKMFNFLGKMILDELTVVHRAALKTLKKIMSSKENPTDMEKLLVELCDADGDFSDRAQIGELVEYAKDPLANK